MQSWPCPCRVGSNDERGNKWAHVLVIVDGQPRYRISGARLLVQSLLSAPHCANLYKAVGPYIPTDTVLINGPCVSREAIGGGFKLLTCMCAFRHGWRSSVSWVARKPYLILALSLLSFKLALASIVAKAFLIIQTNQPAGWAQTLRINFQVCKLTLILQCPGNIWKMERRMKRADDYCNKGDCMRNKCL